MSNNTVTNIKTNNETLAEENNKETKVETVTEKSFHAEMVTESNSSNSKDEANLLQHSTKKEPN